MGVWMVLWTAVLVLCQIGHTIRLLRQNWNQVTAFTTQTWQLVLPKLNKAMTPFRKAWQILSRQLLKAMEVLKDIWKASAELRDWVVTLVAFFALLVGVRYLSSGLFTLVAALRLELSSGPHAPIVIAFVMAAFCFFARGIFESEGSGQRGRTQQNVYSAFLLVLVVTADLHSGLSLGTFLTMISSLIVSLSFSVKKSVREAHFLQRLAPQVDGETFCILLYLYYASCGTCGLLVGIHSYLGLSSSTYFSLAVVVLVVEKYRNCGQLGWLDVRPVVLGASFLYVLWRMLSSVAVAILLYSRLQLETCFKLGAVLLVLMELLLFEPPKQSVVESITSEVAILLERITS